MKSPAEARRVLAGRLEARRAEIEHATLTRVHAVSRAARAVGPEYADGLRTAVAAAVDLGLRSVARGDGTVLEIPAPLLVQARLAARHGVELGTVLRRYSAGYTLLGQFVVGEAERETIPRSGLAQLLEVQAALFDRVVVAVTEEYGRERVGSASVKWRRAELVKRLLDGAFVDASAFAYRFDGHHVAILARGAEAGQAVDSVAELLGGERLDVAPEEGTIWTWLGSRDPPAVACLDHQGLAMSRACVAVGEPGHGIMGWRRSHQQASAAFVVAARRPGRPVRYRDVALVASVAQDELLADSLRQLYLEPLHESRDGGDALIGTLQAYVAAGRNCASAAAALDVSRQTVNNRLRAVEERVGRPLTSCMTALEAALELNQLERATPRIGTCHP